MPESESGKIVVHLVGGTNKRELRVEVSGESKPLKIEVGTASPEISIAVSEGDERLVGRGVQFERKQKKAKFVRSEGDPRPIVQPREVMDFAPGVHEAGGFINPYNFVRAPTRSRSAVGLGDGRQTSHARYEESKVSGEIVINLTTETPLLVFDSQHAGWDAAQHRTDCVLLDADGRPEIPGASFKGALRSAFEAVTNSRMGVFGPFSTPLAFRAPVQSALDLKPARVIDGGTALEIYTEDAWLSAYAAKQDRRRDGTIHTPRPDLTIGFRHGEPVDVLVQGWRKSGPRPFAYTKVVGIGNKDSTVEQNFEVRKVGCHAPASGELVRSASGRVVMNGQSFARKHDERVFLEPSKSVELSASVLSAFAALVDDAREIHKKDIEKRRRENVRPDRYLGHEPGRTAWSRHVWHGEYLTERDRQGNARFVDPDGLFCYVQTDKEGAPIALYPVQISRRLYDSPPRDLLDKSLLPARTPEELSPADRVFGWANPDGDGAVAGSVTIGRITTDADDAVHQFAPDAQPLQILGQPKPSQGRFYAAHDASGIPMDDGDSSKAQPSDRESHFTGGRGLRGRKLYPRHGALPDGYWSEDVVTDVSEPVGETSAGEPLFREYARPGGTRDSQNRSVTGWVKPEVTFRVRMRIRNLSEAEVGALLWLVGNDGPRVLRLGFGKPLGFGTVQAQVDVAASSLRHGTPISAGLLDLTRSAEPLDTGRFVSAFKVAVQADSGTSFEKAPYIRDYIALISRNETYPVRYPRAHKPGEEEVPAPRQQGEGYEWFVTNEDREVGGHSLPLPGEPLPKLTVKERKGRGNTSGGGQRSSQGTGRGRRR